MRGTILFAHGSSRESWRRPFEHILRVVQRDAASNSAVRLAFLELCEPSLASTVDDLVDEGVSHIRIIPLFMSGGGHVLRDLPPQVESCQSRHPHLTVTIEPALGEHPLVLRAICDIAAQDAARPPAAK